MPREGEQGLKIRTGEYAWADKRRRTVKEQTGLILEWGDAITRGINALYDVYVNDGKYTLLELDEIEQILDRSYDGEREWADVTIPSEDYEPAYEKKRELEVEHDVEVTWSDILVVGVEEVFAQVTPAPQPENAEA